MCSTKRGIFMRNFLIICGSIVVVMLFAFLALTARSKSPAKLYKDMTEAEQADAMVLFVAANNRDLDAAGKSIIGDNGTLTFRGDSKKDMLYQVMILDKVLPDSEMNFLKSELSNKPSICLEQYIIELNNIGIGFQSLLEDMAGNILHSYDTCQIKSVEQELRR